MTVPYHGIVSADGIGKVFEGQYTNRREALVELRREAEGIVRNSFEENLTAYYTLYHGDTVVASRQIPMKGLRHIWENYPGNGWHDYGCLEIGGTRIC